MWPQRAEYYYERDVNEEAYLMSLTEQWELYRKDEVVSVIDLPPDGNTINDCRKVSDDGFAYIWDGTSWERPTVAATTWITSLTVLDPLQNVGTASDPVIILNDDSFQDVWSATQSNLTGLTYDNGTSGVWATLTKATAYTSANLWLNGLPVQIGKDYLVRVQTPSTQNGVYTLTSANVLTRATNADTPTELYPQQIRVLYWSSQNTLRSQFTASPVIGTSNIVYVTTNQPAFLTQEVTGTQAVYQIPRWTSVVRQLSKGSNRFTFNLPALLFGVSADIDVTRTISWMYRRILTSAWLFGTAYAWSGMWAWDTINFWPMSTWWWLVVADNWLTQIGSSSPTRASLLTTSLGAWFDLSSYDFTTWDSASLFSDIGSQALTMMSSYPVWGTQATVNVNAGNTVEVSAPWRLKMFLASSVNNTARTGMALTLRDETNTIADYQRPSQCDNNIVDLLSDYTINSVYWNEDNGKTFTNAYATFAIPTPITVTLPIAPVNGEKYTFIYIDPSNSLVTYTIVDPNGFRIVYDDATTPASTFYGVKYWSSITITFDLYTSSWYTTSARGTRTF